MDPIQFLQQNFISPILGNGWFNPYNTTLYAVLLVIGVWYVYKLLTRMKVPMDFRFFLGVLPFIFWGSSTRVLHDAAVANALPPALNAFYIMPIFPTPGSYFITFTLALCVLLVSLLVQKFAGRRETRWRLPYWKVMVSAGTVLCMINLAITPFVTLIPLALILGLTIFWTAMFYPLTRIIPNHFSVISLGILSAHLLDASATFIALSLFGYVEQHVLPRFLIDVIGPVSMFPLKILFIVPVLVIIEYYTRSDKDALSMQFKNLLLITILILGLAPGLRDLLRLMALV